MKQLLFVLVVQVCKGGLATGGEYYADCVKCIMNGFEFCGVYSHPF